MPGERVSSLFFAEPCQDLLLFGGCPQLFNGLLMIAYGDLSHPAPALPL